MNIFRWSVLSLALLISSNSLAEQKKTLGNWDVHYIAFNTTMLTPEIARKYKIKRSQNNILINISVLDRYTQEAQNVEISGTARNLIGRTYPLEFKQVQDGRAIYYLNVLPFDDEEHFRFDLNITQGNNRQRLRFEQKLYRE